MRFSILLSCLAFTFSGVMFGACLLDDYSVTAEFARSVAVFQARVISERNVPDPEAPKFIGGTIYKVRVEESFRGALHGTVEVFSENSTGRFPMEKKKSYLLFLYREDGRLSADPCGNSGLVAQKTNVLATVRALSKATQTDQKADKTADVTFETIIRKPDGSLYADQKDMIGAQGPIDPSPKALQLARDYEGVLIEPKDPAGVYTVEVVVKDNVKKVELRLMRRFTVEK